MDRGRQGSNPSWNGLPHQPLATRGGLPPMCRTPSVETQNITAPQGRVKCSATELYRLFFLRQGPPNQRVKKANQATIIGYATEENSTAFRQNFLLIYHERKRSFHRRTATAMTPHSTLQRYTYIGFWLAVLFPKSAIATGTSPPIANA